MTTAEDETKTRTLCGESEFTELVAEMVADEAPRLFAIVQELGEREDGRITAWGMAFDDHADVVRHGGGSFLSVKSPDRARTLLGRGPGVATRLVWVTPPTPD